MEAEGTAKNPIDPCVEKAVRLMRRTHGLMVPKVIRAVGFASNNADDRCKRVWVHHRVKKKDNDTPVSVFI